MKTPPDSTCDPAQLPLVTELLVLPDGRILVHNLTEPFAALLRELNPNDEQIGPRVPAQPSQVTNHEP